MIKQSVEAGDNQHGCYAAHYIQKLGFSLIPIPAGQKGPRQKGWNLPENALQNPEEAYSRFAVSRENMGFLHSVSGTCALDIDHPDGTRTALAAVGIDLGDLLNENPQKIVGNKSEKPIYLVPEGSTFGHRKLDWPDPKDPSGKKRITIFELRSGPIQDVLPPSIHPESGKPYRWANGVPQAREDLMVLPLRLKTLWEDWESFEILLKEACPWSLASISSVLAVSPSKPVGNNTIAEFNAKFSPENILERNGYTAHGQNRYLYPASTTGTPGIRILKKIGEEFSKAYSDHTADPLNTGHAHDAFSVYTILEHSGNVRAAIQTCAQEFGAGSHKTSDTEIVQSSEAQEHNQRVSKSTRALQIVLEAGAQFWQDDQSAPYLTLLSRGRQEHHRMRSQGVRDYVSYLFLEREKHILGSLALNEVIETLAAQARREGHVYPTGIRVRHWQEKVYLDLGRDDWTVVEIAEFGWQIIQAEACPVRFVRPATIQALPLPILGGSLRELAGLLNTNHQGMILCTAFLLGALSARGPYAHLAFKGEQGVGKSTAATTLQRLIDPNTATRRRAPRKEQDLFIAARSAHILSFDNLSNTSPDFSDGLCCLSTGGSFATRTLHTNDEETVLQAMRPAILNGIADLVTRADLAERTLLIELRRIDPSDRLTEQDMEKRFSQAHPQILGGLLTALATGLAKLPQTHLERPPRLADFATLIVAAESSLPWQPGEFMKVYTAMQDEAACVVLEGDEVAEALCTFLDERGQWEGPVNRLLSLLNEQEGFMSGQRRFPYNWPKNARGFGERLRRMAPALSKVGYATFFLGRRKDGLYYHLQKIESKTFTTDIYAG